MIVPPLLLMSTLLSTLWMSVAAAHAQPLVGEPTGEGLDAGEAEALPGRDLADDRAAVVVASEEAAAVAPATGDVDAEGVVVGAETSDKAGVRDPAREGAEAA